MKMWNKEELGLYTKKQRQVAEEAFWLAAERYENSPHTYKDVDAAWDLVMQYTRDVETRIATKTLLHKQYYGFANIAGADFYADSDEPCGSTREKQLAHRASRHPSWKHVDLEKHDEKIYGMPKYARSGFGY